MVIESPSGCSSGEPPRPPRGAECPRKHVSPERGRGDSAVPWLYFCFSSPERFPVNPNEFPGSLPAPETFPALPLALPRTVAPQRPSVPRSPRCPGHLWHCRHTAHTAAVPERNTPQQPPARSRLRPRVTAAPGEKGSVLPAGSENWEPSALDFPAQCHFPELTHSGTRRVPGESRGQRRRPRREGDFWARLP